ncbi:TolC family protein [Flavobacterium salilacus subsp. salilacus]|uniref:TolC family protein n=1 Tax=Flavobacterium TaxID=237 RepID=UPI001074A217|nr:MULTISPECIES: TolC family protein [Flavobacterium]KAF2519993.1 TolC family protein [Flavobacterium salilacus subsp. salilacus]MBE1614093.1 TolC family protein [Flavobacterium sp. SaA2.13]NDI97820.1 TolC family protein [Flavobacterium salilacus subsp. altitudinum]
MRSKITAVLLFTFTLFTTLSNAQVKKWTLNECVEYALENNISIRQTELDMKLSEIDKKDAFGSFLPTVSFSTTHSWNTGLVVNPITNTAQNTTSQFTNGGLSSGIDIYNGLRNQKNMRRAKLNIIASQYNIKKMQEDIALNVAEAYLQILFNRENLKVQKEQLAADESQQERSEQLLEGGLIPRGDLLDIQATVAADKQRIIEAENQLLISKLSLAQLLQLEDFRNFDIADEEFNKEESEVLLQTPEAIYNKAKEEQTVIKVARANLEVAMQDVAVARSAYQPSLRGFYSLNSSVSHNDNTNYLFDDSGQPVIDPDTQQPVIVTTGPLPFWNQVSDNKGHSFGFQLSIPILNGLSVRNSVERAKVAVERSKLTLEQQELDLERNIYTAYTDAMGSLKAYDASVAAAEAREQSLEYARERYDVGLINIFDFNQAQALSVSAQSDVIRAKYDFIFKVKILEFYFGIPIIQQQ